MLFLTADFSPDTKKKCWNRIRTDLEFIVASLHFLTSGTLGFNINVRI